MYRSSFTSVKSSSPVRARDSYFFSPSPQKNTTAKISTSISHNHHEPSRLSIGPLSPKSPITSSKLAHIKMSSTLPSFQRPLNDLLSNKVNHRDQETPMSHMKKEPQLGVLFHIEKPNLTDPRRAEILFRKEFQTQRKKPEHDEAIDVRKLDEWQMTFGRSKNALSFAKPTELMEQYKSKNKHKEVNQRKDFPSVRQDILNKIVSFPDEDDLLGMRNHHSSKLPSIMDSQILGKGPDTFEPPGNEIRAGARSLEVMQRENNKDILNDLINKKIREFIRTINVDEMTEEQLRVHVKKVAEGVVAQFKTLKGPSGSFIVHNCVESTVKALKSKKQDVEILFMESPKSKNKQQKDNVVIDYEMMEDLLMEKFESCVQDEEDFKDKVKQLTGECYNYKKEERNVQNQIEVINQKFGAILTEEEQAGDKSNKSIARRYGMTLMDMQAKKAEKQYELEDLFKKQAFIREKVAATIQAIQIRENDIEVSRSQKDYYRTQLRDLYYKCLKDDVAVVKEKKNPMGYAWVIRSLWRIHEETKESAFPSFLDSTSIRFIIEYAKAQDELEEYCKANNIMNMIANVEDFRCLYKHIDSAHFNGPESMDQNNTSSSMLSPQQSYKPQVRNLEMMMEYVKDQMTALKRVNLRAKRQVPVGRHAFKAKGVVYKWEEVDPNQIDRIISHQADQSPYDLNSDGQRNSKTEGDHSKIVWEIGMEKLKALMTMRKRELDRLFKQNLAKELDERLKSNLLKAFNFLFGRIGPESHTRFLREKTVYEQNAQGKAKKASMSNNPFVKSPTTSVPNSPMSMSHSKLPIAQSVFGASFYNEPSSPLSPGKLSAIPTNASFIQEDLKDTINIEPIPKSDFNVTRNSGQWLSPGSGGLKKNHSTSRI